MMTPPTHRLTNEYEQSVLGGWFSLLLQFHDISSTDMHHSHPQELPAMCCQLFGLLMRINNCWIGARSHREAHKPCSSDITLHSNVPVIKQCKCIIKLFPSFPGLLISIFPFIKAWLNINNIFPSFGKRLHRQRFDHDVDFKNKNKLFSIHSAALTSQGTLESIPRQPINQLRRWDEKVSGKGF